MVAGHEPQEAGRLTGPLQDQVRMRRNVVGDVSVAGDRDRKPPIRPVLRTVRSASNAVGIVSIITQHEHAVGDMFLDEMRQRVSLGRCAGGS